MVSEGFGPGASGPLLAVVDTPDAAAKARLDGLTKEIGQVAGGQDGRRAAAQPVGHHPSGGHHADHLTESAEFGSSRPPDAACRPEDRAADDRAPGPEDDDRAAGGEPTQLSGD